MRRIALIGVLASCFGFAAAVPASASTMGVPNLEQIPISGTGVLSQPSPYSVWQSGNRDGSTPFYASENGFLTEVSVSHWNNSGDVTVKILIFERGAANNIEVIATPMNMVLPQAPGTAPLITSQTVPGSVPIATGDRIGMTVVGGTGLLHAIRGSSSMYPAPGVFPTTPPTTEPAQGSIYDADTGSSSGPLIRGIVTATPSPPNPPASNPTAFAPRSKPLAVIPATLPVYKGTRKFVIAIGCSGLGLLSRCTGTATLEDGVRTSAAKPAAASLGAAPYDIPDGSTQDVTIPLSKAARNKLAKKGKLKASLVLREQVGGVTVSSSAPVTIKGPKPKKRKG